MRSSTLRTLAGFALLVLLATQSLAVATYAQALKVGPYYADESDLGFKIKHPDDWDLIPPSPDDGNLIAKYDPPTNKYVELGPTVQDRLFLHAWILKFDRRKKPDDGDAQAKGGPRKFVVSHKDIHAWAKNATEKGSTFKVESHKDMTIDKVPATEFQFVSAGDPKLSVKLYAMVYHVEPDLDLAVAFVAPGEPKKWSKYENACETMARSFKRIGLAVIKNPAIVGSGMRDQKRAELQKRNATLPGYKLYETPHYFLITDHSDRDFIDELLMRLEKIHEIYERDYPAEKAEEYRKAGAGLRTGPEERKGDGDTVAPDPREVATCSVVRIFTDKAAYHSYGGPGSSAGYWSSRDQELVLFDDQNGGGRANTWRVLNHEAFHQYIFYFYGNISPHSWYNEGTGDYYAGYQWKNQKFTLNKFLWRTGTIQEAVREGKHVPLKDFVRWTQAEYYGANTLGVDGGQNYAQGWSFIYFLRTGKAKGAKDWNPRWETILDTYLRVLAQSSKLDQAVEEAFQGVDFDALERSWMDYTRS